MPPQGHITGRWAPWPKKDTGRPTGEIRALHRAGTGRTRPQGPTGRIGTDTGSTTGHHKPEHRTTTGAHRTGHRPAQDATQETHRIPQGGAQAGTGRPTGDATGAHTDKPHDGRTGPAGRSARGTKPHGGMATGAPISPQGKSANRSPDIPCGRRVGLRSEREAAHLGGSAVHGWTPRGRRSACSSPCGRCATGCLGADWGEFVLSQAVFACFPCMRLGACWGPVGVWLVGSFGIWALLGPSRPPISPQSPPQGPPIAPQACPLWPPGARSPGGPALHMQKRTCGASNCTFWGFACAYGFIWELSCGFMRMYP